MSQYTRVHITLEGGLLSDKEVVSVSRSKTLNNTTELVNFLGAATQSALDGYVAVTDLAGPVDDGGEGFEGL